MTTLTCALNQYPAGGLSCVSERLSQLDPDRLACGVTVFLHRYRRHPVTAVWARTVPQLISLQPPQRGGQLGHHLSDQLQLQPCRIEITPSELLAKLSGPIWLAHSKRDEEDHSRYSHYH